MRYLILLLLPAIIIISGCQKTYEPTNTSDLTADINHIYNILKDKGNNYFITNKYNLNDSELDNISKSLDNISGNLNELNYLKKISKDDELYNAFKILIDLDLIVSLSTNTVTVEIEAKIIANMVQQKTKQIISLINAGVDIRKYLHDYQELNYTDLDISYTDIIMNLGRILLIAENLELSEEDRKIYDNFISNVASAWDYIFLQNDIVNRQMHGSIKEIYLPYLEKKGMYNEETGNLMEDITKYTINKSMNYITDSTNVALSYVTDSKYINKFSIDTMDSGATKDDRSQIYPEICNSNIFLFEEARKECLEYIKKADFESLVEKMADSNIDDGKTYIIIDDEVCMIKDKDKINFYGKNEICRAIEKRSK